MLCAGRLLWLNSLATVEPPVLVWLFHVDYAPVIVRSCVISFFVFLLVLPATLCNLSFSPPSESRLLSLGWSRTQSRLLHSGSTLLIILIDAVISCVILLTLKYWRKGRLDTSRDRAPNLPGNIWTDYAAGVIGVVMLGGLAAVYPWFGRVQEAVLKLPR
ncbi:hypothetical protein FA95DRAFT_1552654 [Auriscalpium vulgare]|uniref:Uncharacterized protein n=1 Tax=Auriscalpium vulgare TaxID=40419 RepID=A0ACB8SB82_9AGAM|nr:hypothetical protein FA95DRAFT_1552654 [Auriscalpium vulgare]